MTNTVYPVVLMGICTVNMLLAVMAGVFIPLEYHSHFVFEPRDYFLLSFVGFCLGFYQYRSDNEG